MNQFKMPLVAAMQKYYLQKKIPFHMPAHRQGQAIAAAMLQLQPEIFKYDLTEVPGLDDLHCPQTAIAQAQALAAVAFGSQSSYFLVNGTSCGLQALILTICRPDDILIVPRGVHRSVLTGLILSGARPVYLYPKLIAKFAIPAVVSPAELNSCLEQHPAARGVLMLHPTYYGVVGNLAAVAQVTHAKGLPLLVDEAHGGHFCFHRQLPPAALASGADAVVQSTHKTVGALTQAAMLHLNSDRLDKQRLEGCLRLVQSTSPSYLLMASLDAARSQMAVKGAALLAQSLQVAKKLRCELASLKGIEVLSNHHLADYDIMTLDETRLVINVQALGLTGYQVAALLATDYSIQVEMADFYNIVVLLGLNTPDKDGEALYQALACLVNSNNRLSSQQGGHLKELLQLPPAIVALTPRQAWMSTALIIPLEQAVGKISGDSVAVYPPGIPALCPGEIISMEIVAYLLEVRQRALPVQCSGDATLKTIRVLE
ncbi:aminotransferase class I/II-fold pyridoxal phosphate-dependent enzyme [Peptococcaceae bacterium]|nr:aminotransferase class I/II-fold pyridoxal phosphate-dependent enzyme [Peptococcaceae bacterium]